jgi:plastocyanin
MLVPPDAALALPASVFSAERAKMRGRNLPVLSLERVISKERVDAALTKSDRASLALASALVIVLGIPVAATAFSSSMVLDATSPQITKISILNGAGIDQSSQGFSPNQVVVVIGVNNTVVWTDNDSKADENGYVPYHTVTADDNSFSSAFLSGSTGILFNYTFATPGTFSYHCSVHPWMKGVVIVKGTATATSTSTTTTTTTTTPEFPLPFVALLFALGVAAVAFKLARGAPAGPPKPQIR